MFTVALNGVSDPFLVFSSQLELPLASGWPFCANSTWSGGPGLTENPGLWTAVKPEALNVNRADPSLTAFTAVTDGEEMPPTKVIGDWTDGWAPFGDAARLLPRVPLPL